MKLPCRLFLFLLLSTSASATPPQSGVLAEQAAAAETPSRKASSPASPAPRRPPPCQGPSHYRKHPTQGTMLWGAVRKVESDERSTVLAAIDLGRIQLRGKTLENVQVQGGRLVAPALGAEGLVGALMEGTASDGQPVEVAVCDAKDALDDSSMEWYRLEVWNSDREMWENPCIATNKIPAPKVLALQGIWDASGAWRETPGKVTLACEGGVIAKCVQWGYKPWEQREGRSLRELHQACTRMARADYCGNGKSYTQDDVIIDIYDALGISARTRVSSTEWQVERASFEAAWVSEGAACLGQLRDGRELETIHAECPGRFDTGSKDLGDGDVCKVLRRGIDPVSALLRNHSYGKR
jgi:hypothetical protein